MDLERQSLRNGRDAYSCSPCLLIFESGTYALAGLCGQPCCSVGRISISHRIQISSPISRVDNAKVGFGLLTAGTTESQLLLTGHCTH